MRRRARPTCRWRCCVRDDDDGEWHARRSAVWAPHAAERSSCCSAAHGSPMTRGDGGWWRADRGADGVRRYAFSLDGGDPRPDPRAPRLPDGSARAVEPCFDPAGFAWTDAGWRGRAARRARSSTSCTSARSPPRARSTRRSTGSTTWSTSASRRRADAASRRSPAGTAGGTTGSRLYAVHEPYGGPAALQRFVDAAHAPRPRRLPRRRLQPPRPGRQLPRRVRPVLHRPLPHPVGPGAQPRRRRSRRGARASCVDNALLWLRDFHVDGAAARRRARARTTTAPLHFLEELSDAVDALAARARPRRCPWSPSPTSTTRATVHPARRGAGGLGLHAQWADDFHHALHAALTGETQGYYADFADARARWPRCSPAPFFHDGTLLDVPRPHPRPPGRHRAHARAGGSSRSLQTHDQVGNRAHGRPALGTAARPGAAGRAGRRCC